MAKTRKSMFLETYRKEFSKEIRLEVIRPPPTTSKLKGVKQVPYSDQPTVQGMHCSLHVVVQGQMDFHLLSVLL